MVVGSHTRFETDVEDAASTLYANVILDCRGTAQGPAVIALRLWEGDRRVSALTQSGPYGRQRATRIAEWLREQRWRCNLPEDGDRFFVNVRAAIRELIGACYEENPDIRP